MHGDYVKVFVVSNSEVESIDEPPHPAEPNDESTIDIDLDETLLVPEKRVQGFVIKIDEKRNNRLVVGTIQSKDVVGKNIKFVPRDMRVGIMFIKKKKQSKEVLRKICDNESMLALVKIEKPKEGHLYGTIVRLLGKSNELLIENDAILVQNGLDPTPYAELITSALPTLDFEIPDEEYKKREDLRDTCIFSIDPPTARDLDDAVSLKILNNGNFEIGVHISDVSYFIKEKSRLDEIIKDKTTSVYMVDRVYHMLPEQLCLLCSLLPGEDKLAYSVIWEMTKTGEILNTRFTRSIINSCAKLAYDHAQQVIENPEKEFTTDDFPEIFNGYNIKNIVAIIKQLQSSALILRKKRFDNGALRINQPKIRISLDPETKLPISFCSEAQNESNRLIEDFMLLANQSVAEFIYNKFPEIAVLRNHLPPKQDLLKNLATKLAAYNIDYDITSSKSIRESLAKHIAQSKNPDVMDILLSKLTARPMRRATYLCSNQVSSPDELCHYALSIPIYTHFTSPIRRYPDILVHRLLSAALQKGEEPTRSVKELRKIMDTCNDMKFNAKNAGDECIDLYFMHYIKSKGSLKMEAGVLLVLQYNIDVVLLETGHELRISYKVSLIFCILFI